MHRGVWSGVARALGRDSHAAHRGRGRGRAEHITRHVGTNRKGERKHLTHPFNLPLSSTSTALWLWLCCRLSVSVLQCALHLQLQRNSRERSRFQHHSPQSARGRAQPSGRRDSSTPWWTAMNPKQHTHPSCRGFPRTPRKKSSTKRCNSSPRWSLLGPGCTAARFSMRRKREEVFYFYFTGSQKNTNNSSSYECVSVPARPSITTMGHDGSKTNKRPQ